MDDRTKRRESAWASLVEFSPNISFRTLLTLFATLAVFWLIGVIIGWVVDDVSTGQAGGLIVGYVAWLVLVVVALYRSNRRGWRYRGHRRPQ